MSKSVGIYKAIEQLDERHIRGHAAGLLFRAEAAARGYIPSTPEWNISIDHILIKQDDHAKLVRVEVKQSKQARMRKKNGPAFTVELRTAQGIGGTSGSKKGQKRLHKYEGAVDMFAILLAGTNEWYLIPERGLRGRSSVTLCPEDSNAAFAEYKDNWAVLAG
ncbi:hypothetical protein [Prosthecobacter sp.]|uniref:hypothetical protein n=1 Tax=Prosthecobacter sp. TaxID=1965333 RepID=UPI003784E6B1